MRRALIIFLPLAIAAGLGAYILYSSQSRAIDSTARASDERTVEIAQQRAAVTANAPISDLSYLVEQAALQRWLASGDLQARENLIGDYLAFLTHKPNYDQVRFLDLTGKELIRLDRSGGFPHVVADGQLQDKSDRYYVREALALERGRIYVSPFDLSVENGAIEQPIKPTIRVAAAVFDDKGEKRGLIFLNYLGRPLLERIKLVGATSGAEVWFVNADGYWLIGPAAENEWSFMYPGRAGSFASEFPDAWRAIRDGAGTTQITVDGHRFTTALVSTANTAQASGLPAGRVSDQSWYVIAHRSPNSLAAMTADLRRNFIIAAGLITVLLALVSLAIGRHVTHRVQAEGMVQASEARLRAVTETASDAIISADRTGNIRYFNPAAERIFGYAAGEIVDQPLTLLMPERFRRAHAEGLQRYLSTREAKLVGKTIEIVGRRKDGSEFPIDLALASSEVGHDLFFTAIIRDITTRAEAERSLRASEARFRDLLESAPDAVLITGDDGRIQIVNVQTERLFGYRREELVGRNIDILVPQRYRAQHPQHRANYVAEAKTRPMGAGLELYGLRKDGSEFPVSISLSPTRSDQNLTVFCDVRDITDQRLAEARIKDLNQRLQHDNAELAAVNKELEAFSYSVSHDLRAPLRAIDGFSQALVEDAGPLLTPEHHSHLNRVRQAAQRMGHLIDDLLKLARVTRADLKIEDVDLTQIARDVANALQEAAPERATEFVIAPDLSVKGDPRLLQIVLENLLSNSWKFTAPRRPAHIEFGRILTDDLPTYFVRDDGVGFDMTYAGKMFGAFQRFHDTRDFVGTGIGLATVQRIIHKHGGRIWAESQPEKGATFYFTI